MKYYVYLSLRTFFFKFPVQGHSYFLTFYMCVVSCLEIILYA